MHRPAYLDYVGVKRFDERGEVIGERRFLGLFTSAAYIESVQRIPVLRRKTRQVLEQSGYPPNSHGGKDLVEILETYPRDELFQTRIDELTETVTAVLHLQERRRLRLFMRSDDYGRYISCLVYLPRDRYTTDVRLAMQQIFTDTIGSDLIDFTARVTESVLARLHFVIRMPRGRGRPRRRLREARGRPHRGRPGLGGRRRRRAPARVRGRPGGQAAAPLRRSVPRGVQGGLRRRDGGHGHAPAGRDRCRRGRPRVLPPAGRQAGRAAFQDLPPRRRDLALRGAPGAAAHGRRGGRRAAVRDHPAGRQHRLDLRLRPALPRARAGRHRPTSTTSGAGSRTRSTPPGADRPRATASTRW